MHAPRSLLLLLVLGLAACPTRRRNNDDDDNDDASGDDDATGDDDDTGDDDSAGDDDTGDDDSAGDDDTGDDDTGDDDTAGDDDTGPPPLYEVDTTNLVNNLVTEYAVDPCPTSTGWFDLVNNSAALTPFQFTQSPNGTGLQIFAFGLTSPAVGSDPPPSFGGNLDPNSTTPVYLVFRCNDAASTQFAEVFVEIGQGLLTDSFPLTVTVLNGP